MRLGDFLVLSLSLACTMQAQDEMAHAQRLRSTLLGIDTHIDTIQRVLVGHVDLGQRLPDGQIDLPRLAEGGMHAPFFALWVPTYFKGAEAVRRTLDLRDAMQSVFDRYPERIQLATTGADLERIVKSGKIAAVLTLEGGHQIADDLAVLRMYQRMGIRSMTLTHFRNNNWADSSTDKPLHNGLTEFGKDVVREMNRIGMIVDISHVSDKTFYDALEVSKAPLFASHSSCRAICDAARNMTDQMIKDLAAKGGAIQINYHVGFLSQEFRDAEKANPELNKAINADVMKLCGENEGCQLIEGDRITREYVEQGKLPRVDFTRIIEHIDHAVKVAGIDHVGLGSDFDGANMPYGMEDATKLPKITEALLQKGYSEGDVKKILGENTLRVMTEVERVSRDLNSAPKK